MAVSSSHERKIQGYLKPCNHTFITKYAATYEMTESQAVNAAVKCLQDTMPKEIKERIMRFDKNKNSY